MNDGKDPTLIIHSRFPVVVETDAERRAPALLEKVARQEGQALFVRSAEDGLCRRDNPLVCNGQPEVPAS